MITRWACRVLLLAASLAIAPVAVAVAGARPSSGAPIKIGSPGPIGRPSIAVDTSGTAYVAWPVRKDLSGGHDFIEYCVLRSRARACEHSGKLRLADSAFYVDSPQVLLAGREAMIVADVYRTVGPMAENYEPVQEWRSTNGGRSFKLVDRGLSVISGGTYDSNQQPLNAVILPGSSMLGYGCSTAGQANA